MSAQLQTLRVRAARSNRTPSDEDPPDIRLRHGQAVWVLSQLGFQGSASANTFYEYIKSLRKLGLPFARGDRPVGSSRLAIYGYEHLMELALALSLRVYHGLPDAVLVELIRHRAKLNGLYRAAYRQREGGVGARIRIKGPSISFEARGAFLDLQINYNGGALAAFGPPRLLSPPEAIEVYATSAPAARALLPMKLSELAENVVELAARAPNIRSGPARSAVRTRARPVSGPTSRPRQRAGNVS